MFSRIRGLKNARLGHGQTYSKSPLPRHTLNFRATRYHVPSGPQYNQASVPPNVRLPTLKELWLIGSEKLISWEKYSVALAILGAVGSAGFYYTHQQDVLFLKRKQFNFTSLESAIEWMESKDVEMMFTRLTVVALAKHAPEKLLPDDHPTSTALSRVLKRVVAAGHLNDENRAWDIGIFLSNAQIAAGDEVHYAGMEGLVVMDSARLSFLENEAALATYLSRKLASFILRHHEEELSHWRFLSFAPVPAVPMIITSMVNRRLLMFTLPYAAAYAAVWWYFRKLHLEFDNERSYVGFRIARQLGYDLNEYIRYLDKGMNEAERLVREYQHLLEVEDGQNLPTEVKKRFEETVRLMDEKKAKIRKWREYIPEIMAATANDAIMVQESRKIPLPLLERREDPPPRTE